MMSVFHKFLMLLTVNFIVNVAYFNNVMTKFMINNRTDTLLNLLQS